jgi:hypothetical protein
MVEFTAAEKAEALQVAREAAQRAAADEAQAEREAQQAIRDLEGE